MRVSMIKNNTIKNFILPNKIFGNFWITDIDDNGNEQNIINIEAKNNTWNLISNDEVYYAENGYIQPSALLNEFSFYNIKDKINDKTMLLYCSPIYDKTLSYYDMSSYKDKQFIIGKNHKCDLVYGISAIEDQHAIIIYNDEGFTVYDNNSGLGVYVNNARVIKSKKLKIGDVIFITGLKIIVMMIENRPALIVNNPNNLVSCKVIAQNLPKGENNPFDEPSEELEMNLYKQDDYFHKKPRFISVINELELNIDSPPAKENEQSTPALLTIGPMLTMSMTSLVTGYSALNGVLNGDATWEKAMPSLIICGAMLASTFLWPILTKIYEKTRKMTNERQRQKKYSKYIEQKRQQIIEEVQNQRGILLNTYPQILECQNIILNKQANLWEKRIEDSDFLTASIGYGTIPMKINIKYPEDRFSMTEDNLKEIVSKLGKEPKNLTDVPIPFSFIENYISAVIGTETQTKTLARNVLLQLMTFHSYDNLKIVVFTDKEKEHNWDFLKILPHCWNDDNTFRYIASTQDEYKELCYNLDKILSFRKENISGSTIPNPQNYDQLYLIITDSFRAIRNYDFIENILESKNNFGFSVVMLTDKITSLPDQCQAFMQLTDKKCELFKNIANNEHQIFALDSLDKIDIYKCAQTLANIPISIDNKSEGQLPSKIGFLEMYDVGKIEQLNSLNRWEKNTPIQNMQVPVGVGKSGERISLDLHEKYHGPHGLIAGMTGSGKSEFIITYILSMAVNYHPHEVQFILIDYKGGGLAGAFENATTGLKLPHLVGTITNLDLNEIKRSLASIESELKRRQKAFNVAREKSGESTIDIYKYQKMYREKIVEEPVSHLFIIADEFAELRTQQPEFMEQLISTARIGRSLGVHLILATQKPSGVVDPQIWSNTRFRVCLRVQEKSDSTEVIKCPDAAFLKQTGRFYLQVGFNEIFVLGQSAWAGGQYYPSEKIKKTIDSSTLFINNIGYVIKSIENKKKNENVQTKGEELINVLQYLSDLSKQQSIKTRPLWLEKIPSFITIPNLSQKYMYNKENFVINPIIGEYDIPSMQEQKLLTIPFSKEGNAIVYGAAGSGKENFITTTIYSSMLHYTPEEVNYYILDFGAEILKCFTNSPIVGDIIYTDDAEKIKNLFKMITQTIDERKKAFANYNGDYLNYCRNSGRTVPNIVIVINNYEAYQETYPDYDEKLIILTRDCSKYGVYFLLTANTPNGIRFKLRQNFPQLFVLQQNNDDDYTTILGNVHKNFPSKIFGRGIIRKDNIHEFQTALVAEKDTIPNIVKERCDELSTKYTNKAPKIPILPEIVTYQTIANELGKSDELIIGIDKETLQIAKYNINKSYTTIVSAIDLVITSKFITPLTNQLIALNKNSLIVINAEDYELNNNKQYYQYIDSNFDDTFQKISKYVTDNNELYKNNNYNKSIFSNVKPITCVIIGIDSLKNKLSDENKINFGSIFEKGKDLGIINFILVDSIDKIKKIELEPWYKTTVNSNEGIWIGHGINDQFSLKIVQKTKEMKEEITNDFCFLIKRGKPILVKYVEEFNIKQN